MSRTFQCLAIVLAVCLCLLGTVTMALAQTPEELAKETETYVASTAKDTPIKPETIIAKVNEACKVLQAEGEAAFPKFQGSGSPFLFLGTYIWIHDLDSGEMQMHPIKYKLNGKQLLGLKDKKGKRFFVTMNKVVQEKGDGWVRYYWPKPGSNEIVEKVSYVKGCKIPSGKTVVIGCGIYKYQADPADIAKLDVQ